LLDLKAVALREKVVKAARRLAVGQRLPGRTEERSPRTDHVCQDVNRAQALCGEGVTFWFTRAGGGQGSVIVQNVVNDVDGGRCVVHEAQQRGMLRGAEFAAQGKRISDTRDHDASLQAAIRNSFLDVALVFEGIGV